jgi:hypothetical protein
MARNAAIKVQIDQKAITQFFTTDPEAQLGLFANAEALRETASDLTPYGRSKGQYRQRGGAGGHPVGPFGTPYGHGFAKVSYHTRKFRGGFRVYSRDWYINVIEYGSTKNPVYAPMRKAMRAIRGAKAVIYPSKTTTTQATEGEHTGGIF